uniref:Uncharacterized protein n=1 Tax=Ciona intestinalis TaxID=7719 RepID=H2XU11_CIOIN
MINFIFCLLVFFFFVDFSFFALAIYAALKFVLVVLVQILF